MKHKKAILALAIAVLLAVPMTAAAHMWVGGYLGGNFAASSELKYGFSKFDNVARDAAVIGGGTIGYDFVNEGFLGYAYPDWMKYFSFAIDLGYHNLNIGTQSRSGNIGDNAVNNAKLRDLSGSAWTLAFLFMGHYGFFPDSEVPAGRLHPYIGIGPAIVFSDIDGRNVGFRPATSTNIALCLESGLRFFALKNVSMDLAFRWRTFHPEYTTTTSWNNPFGYNAGRDVKVSSDMNLFNVLFRVAYHF